MNPRFLHLADLLCREHEPPQAAKAAAKINNTLDGFSGYFLFHYAMEKAGVTPKKGKAGSIYFMQDTANGDVKIGFSDGQVAKRYEAHTTARQSPVGMLFQFHGHYADETKCHELFSLHNIRGEWYKGNDIVLSAIAAMSKMASETPACTPADLLTEASWNLHFWGREAEGYKAILSAAKT
jgi:hypothetical protein